MPGCFPKEWRAPTWLQDEVVKNGIKAMSLQKGDAMAIHCWQMSDGKPQIQISGPEGGPIHTVIYDLKKLSVEKIRLMRALLADAVVADAE